MARRPTDATTRRTLQHLHDGAALLQLRLLGLQTYAAHHPDPATRDTLLRGLAPMLPLAATVDDGLRVLAHSDDETED
jgi:hypothetical protein